MFFTEEVLSLSNFITSIELMHQSDMNNIDIEKRKKEKKEKKKKRRKEKRKKKNEKSEHASYAFHHSCSALGSLRPSSLPAERANNAQPNILQS